MTSHKIVAYRPDLREQVVALYSDVFRLKPEQSRTYLEWKHERNPYLAGPLAFVACDESGTVVGMRSFYGSCWEVGGRRLVIPCADDFAIAPGERNKGLMTAIMRVALDDLAQRGYEWLLNASGGMLTVLQSLAMGWRSLGPMEPVVRLSRIERFRRAMDVALNGRPLLWRLVRVDDQVSQASFRHLDRAAGGRSSRGDGIIVESSPRAEAMATLASLCPRQGRVCHVRDQAFFRWRYGNPGREYRFLYLLRGGELQGFLVLGRHRKPESGKPSAIIVDWEARHDDVRADLLGEALTRGRFASIGTWSASFSAQWRTILARYGFQPADLDLRARGLPCVLLKQLGKSNLASPDLGADTWDIRPIDSMHG